MMAGVIRLFLRLLQRSWATRRTDATWLRSALSGGEATYLYGVVSAVDGATIEDTVRPALPVDLWGAFSSPGLPGVPGMRLRMTSGAKSGTAWVITSIRDKIITLAGVADLEAEGVAPNDTYRIEDPAHDEALTWFASVNLTFSQQFPADLAVLPSVVVRQGARSADKHFIGGILGERAIIGGVVTELLTVEHSGSMMAAAMAVHENEAQWLEAFVLATMMEHARQITGLFDENFSWSLSGVNQAQIGNLEVFGTELTLQGLAHHMHRIALPTIIPDQAQAQVDHNEVRVELP